MRVSTVIRPLEDPCDALPSRALSIGVIGGLSLSAGGVPLSLGNRKARAILAYLALEGAVLPRERVAAMFWGESPERHARNSLRQTLFELREALALQNCRALDVRRDEVRLISGMTSVDFLEVLDAIAAGRLTDILSRSIQNTELLLAGYEDLSADFRDWVATTRRQAQNRLLRALETAYQNPDLAADVRRQLAEVAQQLDPLNESACRSVMQLAAAAGEVGIALRAYSALYDAVGLQLDMEPSEATQALVAEIKLGRMTAESVPKEPDRPRSPRTVQVEPLGGAPVVAVLPLRTIGTHELTGWIADAISEDLVRILAGLREPVVISNNSTRHLRGEDIDLTGVAERLGAGYLVSGSVRMVAAFGRITVELVQASTGAVLWGEAYDITTSQIFETVEQIAASIANALGPRVNAAELRRSLGQPPDDLGAYHLLLRARDLIFKMGRDTLGEGGALIAEAIRREPGYAGAHAARAYWYSLRIFQGWSADPQADIASLIEAAQTAIRLDPDHARALALLGHNLTLAAHRYAEAERLVDRAVATAPNDAEVLITSTPTCAYVGRAQEAVRRAERAMLLSPQDPFLFRYEHFRSLAHYAAEEFEAAAHWGLRSTRSNPNFTSNLRITIASLSATGRLEEARSLAEQHIALQPDYRVARLATTSTFREPEQREQFARLLAAAGVP